MILTSFTPTPPYPERILGPDALDHPARSRDHRPHLTDILRDLADSIGRGKGDGKGDTSEDDLNWYASGGWLWEQVFNLAHSAAIADGTMWSPGEMECEGIVGTPDRLTIHPEHGLTVVELKCRWASARKFDDLEKNYWMELSQIQGYCYMNSTLHADLHVFFVAGDWRPPIPQARSVHIEFTEREVVDNWNMLRKHAVRKGWLRA